MVFNLTNTNATPVDRNLIYGLTVATNSAAAQVNGIHVSGGTTIYRNNMIALGAGIANAIGLAGGNSETTGINGINGLLGTDSFYHTTVFTSVARRPRAPVRHTLLTARRQRTLVLSATIFSRMREPTVEQPASTTP